MLQLHFVICIYLQLFFLAHADNLQVGVAAISVEIKESGSDTVGERGGEGREGERERERERGREVQRVGRGEREREEGGREGERERERGEREREVIGGVNTDITSGRHPLTALSNE